MSRDAQGPNEKKTRFSPFYSRRETELPAPGRLCRTTYLQRCRGQLVASGTSTAATTNAFGTAIDNGYYRHVLWNQPELTTLCAGWPLGVCTRATGAR